jgi:hypothetical protein
LLAETTDPVTVPEAVMLPEVEKLPISEIVPDAVIFPLIVRAPPTVKLFSTVAFPRLLTEKTDEPFTDVIAPVGVIAKLQLADAVL